MAKIVVSRPFSAWNPIMEIGEKGVRWNPLDWRDLSRLESDQLALALASELGRAHKRIEFLEERLSALENKVVTSAAEDPCRTFDVNNGCFSQRNVLVKRLDLSVRSSKCLERAGITTLGELCAKTETDLLGEKNFGRTSLNEIKTKLEERGLKLKPDDKLPERWS